MLIEIPDDQLPELAPHSLLRVKQCTNCLHFRPVALFKYTQKAGGQRRLQSWCRDCTAQRTKHDHWTPDPSALSQALNNWKPS